MRKFTSVIARHGWSILLALFIAAPAIAAPGASAGLSGELADRETVKSLIREVLNEDPELLLQALQNLQAHVEAQQVSAALAALGQSRAELDRDPHTYVAGNPDGDITLIEFFDYRCGYCKKARPIVEQLVETDGNIRLVLKEFPILGPNSEIASKAAIASISQGKYERFHRALMDSKGALSEARIMRVARDSGIDTEQLRRDMELPHVSETVRKNRDLAVRLGISGTPAFIVGDKIVPGVADLAQMQQLVAAARKRCVTC